jgi:hypothetical protein
MAYRHLNLVFFECKFNAFIWLTSFNRTVSTCLRTQNSPVLSLLLSYLSQFFTLSKSFYFLKGA